jgi:hypothetical protein
MQRVAEVSAARFFQRNRLNGIPEVHPSNYAKIWKTKSGNPAAGPDGICPAEWKRQVAAIEKVQYNKKESLYITQCLP